MVEVRSAQEILATLDERASVDAMPFMPEMLQFCGKRFQVHRRADKTCDTISFSGGRRLERTVHLGDLRCDGRAHGGCQAGCLLFWKEAWLKRVPDAAPAGAAAPDVTPADRDRLERAARTVDAEGERFTCQATELLRASSPLPWWDARQYLRDVVTGNVSWSSFVRGTAYAVADSLRRRRQWLLDTAVVWGGRARRRLGLPKVLPARPKPASTPAEPLDLRAGDMVTVKPREEIRATLDQNSRNRGLFYDVAEMCRFSGGTYRVLRPVQQIIDEKTGRMMNLRGGCVVLDGVVCSGERSSKRRFCPRAIFPYWRQIWLKRVS
jgi:hypothetical protein